jgi:hypothetical protein
MFYTTVASYLTDLASIKVEMVLKMLFTSATSSTDSCRVEPTANKGCELWGIAQQRSELDDLCELKRVSVERDAKLQSEIIGVKSTSFPLQRSPCQQTNNKLIGSAEIDSAPSVFSQLLKAIDDTSTSTLCNTTTCPIVNTCEEQSMSELLNLWVDILLQDREAYSNDYSNLSAAISTSCLQNGTFSILIQLLSDSFEEIHVDNVRNHFCYLLKQITSMLWRGKNNVTFVEGLCIILHSMENHLSRVWPVSTCSHDGSGQARSTFKRTIEEFSIDTDIGCKRTRRSFSQSRNSCVDFVSSPISCLEQPMRNASTQTTSFMQSNMSSTDWNVPNEVLVRDVARQYGLNSNGCLQSLRHLLQRMDIPIPSLKVECSSQSKLQTSKQTVDRTFLKQFLQSNSNLDIFQDILMSIPISDVVIRERLRSIGLDISPKTLLELLASLDVLVSVSMPSINKP